MYTVIDTTSGIVGLQYTKRRDLHSNKQNIKRAGTEIYENMIELKQIGYCIGEKWLVRNISVTIETGTLCCLIGPNGAGKSTLLRLMSGELVPTTGEIRLFGNPHQPIHNYEPRKFAKIRGYLQQKREMNFPFTSLEIVLLGRYPHLNGKKESRRDVEIAEDALYEVEADTLSERLYLTLSGGEASRVDVARILAQSPQLFLLDEPTNHLDPKHQIQILNLCKMLCATGKTVITAIHDLNLAAMYADRLLMLKDGVPVACGTPKAVLTLNQLSEVYGISFDILSHPSGTPWVIPKLDCFARKD